MSKVRPSPLSIDTALDALPLPAFRAGEPGRLMHANAACCALLALSAAEAAGEGWLCRIAAGERPLLLAAWQQAQANGEPLVYQCRLQLPGGSQEVLLQVQDGVASLQAGVVPAAPRGEALGASLPYMVYRCRGDAARTLEYCSGGCQAITGLPVATMLGRPEYGLTALLHAEDAATVQQQYHQQLANRLPCHLEYRLVAADGSVKWVEDACHGVYDAAGQLVYVQGFLSDISHHHAGKAVRQPALQEAYDNAPELLLSLDPYSGLVLNCNRTLLDVLGYQRENLVGHPVFEFHTPASSRQLERQVLPALLLGEDVRGVPLEVLASDGDALPVVLDISAVRDAEGRIIRARAQWHSPQALQRRVNGLEADLRLHAQILDSMLEGVCLVGAGGQHILYANPRLLTMYGYPQGSMSGLPLARLLSPDGQTLPASLQPALQEQAYWQAEWQCYRLDGSRFWTRTGISLFRHPRDGMVWLVSQQDISHSRQAQQQLALSSAELQAVASIQGDYIENHDEQHTYETILAQLLQLTGSAYGLVGEVLHDADGEPFLRVHALTDISWDAASRAAYASRRINGLEFRRQDTLLGHTLRTCQPLITHHPAGDERSGGQPAGHPALDNFMALPVMHGEEMVGLVGVANRAGGYDEALLALLQPLLVTYGQVISATRSRNEYRQASEALRQAEERWKFAIEGAGHGVWDWSVATRQVVGSALLARMLGYEEQELSCDENDWRMRVHPDDRQQVEDSLQPPLNGPDNTFIAEHRVLCKDGSYIWVLGRGMVIGRDRDGHPLRMIGTFTDISHSKATELALKANQLRLSTMIDTAMDGIITTDARLDIVVFNPAAERMFGVSAANMIGQPLDCLLPTGRAERHRELMLGFADEAKLSGGMTSRSARPLLGRRADGSQFPVEVSISYADNGGEPIYTAMVRDITERKAAEEELLQLATTLEYRVQERTSELQAAREVAESANRAKSSFLANMSHEIRTPLNNVLGMAHLAQQTALDDKQRDYLNKIAISGQHLLALINDILDFSKIEAGKLELDETDFDLRTVLDELRDVVAQKAAEKRLQLDIQLEPQVPRYLHGDVLRLRQVLLNLLSNAIKFTEQGMVRLLVVSQPDDGIRFSVRDSGIGMSADVQTRLFQSFEQADSSTSRKYGGTGLGLAISYQLVQLMGGSLQVASQQGQGSEFSFELHLPVVRHAPPPAAVARPVADYRRQLGGKRVLLADDHPFNQQVATELLQAVGMQVSVAGDGLQALQLAARQTFDVVLMDMQMPELDGVEATRQLRREPAFDQVPIIAMTANVSTEDRQRCLHAGMNDFIGKPVQPDKLYHTLAYWLNDSLAQQPPEPAAAEPAATVAAAPLLDCQVLHTMLGDDADKQRHYCDKFAQWLREGLAALQLAVTQLDSDAVARESHRLKSVARTVGAMALGEALAELEKWPQQRGTSELPRGLEAVRQCFAATCAELQQRQLLTADPAAATATEAADTAAGEGMRLMLVDDDAFTLDYLQQQLLELPVGQVVACNSAQAALARLDGHAPPDWLVCDLQMPDMDGIAFLRLLGELHYPGRVVILSGMDSHVLKATERLARSFGLDFQGALAKPVSRDALRTLLAQQAGGRTVRPSRSMSEPQLDEAELRRGLQHGAIELYYQPKVDTASWQVHGAECLARWHHPQLGLLGPGLFVPMMESLGLIDEMTFIVLQLAMQQQQRWQQQGLDLQLAVNVSMDNLSRLELPEQFAELAQQHGVAPGDIMLEITETRLGRDHVMCLDILTRLRIKGFGLSIDDFGTGFSTMEHLMRTPFTELKIDRAFVTGASRDPWARTILEESVSLGRRFALKLVAEGVETQEDLDLVVAAGCQAVQGYFIARPMAAGDFVVWLQQWQQRHERLLTSDR
ncbi:EAL domain-containing protein [Vogesella sp. LIG4]|uniref:EAL domain-containing protein n=1 Tax=Vogesella sp. LIG4 TaxID=1192162 RepID=UPI00081FBFC0|nr:EAL domain-containing protein [Vogesella sp. LIG4]SCK18400.1 PAS domain S-box-containing protein [Vogesella sp. LIG4]